MALNRMALKPKRNSFVKFQLVEGSQWQHAKVLSVQPKQTGKYGKRVNVHVMGEEEPRNIDWSQAHNWRNVPHSENVVMMTQGEELAQEVADAKKTFQDNFRVSRFTLEWSQCVH